MYKGLTERQKAVVETMRMRLTEAQALHYLKEEYQYDISDTTWYREKKKINKLKLKRLHLIAAIGFEDQHLDRIDVNEIIEKEMWKNYRECEDRYKRVMILKEIKELQPYISSYYEATKEVVKPARQEDTSISEDNTPIPTANEWI